MSFDSDHAAQFITSVATLVTALASVYVSVRNSNKIDTTHQAIAEVVKNTDGIKDALVAATAAKSHAEGVVEGKEIEKANPTS